MLRIRSLNSSGFRLAISLFLDEYRLDALATLVTVEDKAGADIISLSFAETSWSLNKAVIKLPLLSFKSVTLRLDDDEGPAI
jgi:hypothetical protein